jgi:hypothetical protein
VVFTSRLEKVFHAKILCALCFVICSICWFPIRFAQVGRINSAVYHLSVIIGVSPYQSGIRAWLVC